MSLQKIVLGLVICSSVGRTAKAWGVLGHQATALIAEAYLNDSAKQMVKELLAGKRLVDVAMEADNLRDRPEFSHTKNYHFQNIDFYSSDDKVSYRNQIAKDSSRGAGNYKAGAVEAIVEAQENLSDQSLSESQRKMALKFLVHFVADLHQPLHTGLKRQKGGNLEFMMWDHQSQNLHQIWDSAIIQDSAAETNRTGRAQAWNYANHLIQNNHGPSKSFAMGTPEAWFIESLQFQKMAIKDIKRLNQQRYEEWAKDVIDARIFWGGRRLAEMINLSANSKRSNLSEYDKFKNWLKNQLGDLQNYIKI